MLARFQSLSITNEDDARGKVADAIDGGERPKCDAMLRRPYKFGAKGILESFLHRQIYAADREYGGKRPQIQSSTTTASAISAPSI